MHELRRIHEQAAAGQESSGHHEAQGFSDSPAPSQEENPFTAGAVHDRLPLLAQNTKPVVNNSWRSGSACSSNLAP